MDITKLQDLLSSGQDNALMRFTIGSLFFNTKKYEQALEHLEQAVSMDKHYSAAWKLYGRCLVKLQRHDEAKATFTQGLAMAKEKGDMQAVKEMQVFLNRLK